jgi:hypothetical protein
MSNMVAGKLELHIAALLIIMSKCGINVKTFAAVARTEGMEDRSICTNVAVVLGLISLIESMTGWILDRVRPRRRIVSGFP